jgi:hypothetical protein
MYRDGATHLDEHDRAVGAIQIADGLITACGNAVKKLQGPETPERWRAAHALHDDYPEIWGQLDTARHVLAGRGANTIAYDELRGRVVPVLAIRDDDKPLDLAPLDDARRAIAELRLAVPGADWKGIEARTRGLVGTPLVRRGQRAALAAWANATIPAPRIDPRVEMRRELAVVVDERRDRIDELHDLIGDSCDRFPVHELMKLLVMEGRWREARTYADRYEARCGEDIIVRKWADAPVPRSAR